MPKKGIGNTPLWELTRESAFSSSARIFAKAECENLGGSVKDRVAFAILEDAEQKGLLKKGGTVVEATSGNTGIGLALAAKAKGYKAIIVMPENMSIERRAMITAYGGETVLTDAEKGMRGSVERAKELAAETSNCIFADQFNNPVCAEIHYRTTGKEIWEQTGGEADIFVACVGTGGTITGIGRFLKEKKPQIKVVAVEPQRSPLLSKGYAGVHGVQGIGANFIPSVLDCSIYDEVVTVDDEEAFKTARKLQELGYFIGISSGAAVAAAYAIAKLPENKGKTIVTVLPDSGDRYRSVL